MKGLIHIIRILTGLLFIFSGLVKAIDPRGLAYKMQEFFEAWSAAGFVPKLMHSLDGYALGFSIFMITLEVAAGLALLLGWQRRSTTWILFLLMLFFTFLTSYVLFSGKIRACGCFGDCIPLTPVQTFTKDILLLIFSILLLSQWKKITPVFSNKIRSIVWVTGVAATCFLQYYVLKNLPPVDCLPYKVGNNLMELRKMPANAVMDEYKYSFIYAKNGTDKEFEATALPDSTWTFKDRKQTMVKAGSNNVPLINDFNFTDNSGTDVTEDILATKGRYYLFFIKEVPDNVGAWADALRQIQAKHNEPFYVITAQSKETATLFNQQKFRTNGIFTTDGTAIKTAARANPTLFVMQGPIVQQKLSWANLQKIK